jgi:hypothetical protein
MNPGIWNWFWWFIFGTATGVGLTALWFSLKDKVSFKWYEWLLAVLSVLLFSFMVQTFFASFAEQEPKAAWLSLVFLGVPTIVLVVITARSVQSRIAKTG